MTIDKFQGSTRWLSSFQLCDVSYDEHSCKTVEHAYQAAKTKDPIEQEWVRNAKTPAVARKRGQRVTLRGDWEDAKVGVMTELVYQKFSKDEHLKKLLLSTGSQHLIEGNDWGDKFWGVCDGEGLNHLGRILMDVRGILRKVGDSS